VLFLNDFSVACELFDIISSTAETSFKVGVSKLGAVTTVFPTSQETEEGKFEARSSRPVWATLRPHLKNKTK
jgi:hypothetical protein